MVQIFKGKLPHRKHKQGLQMLKSAQLQATYIQVGFEVFTAANMKMAFFWVVALCSLVEVYTNVFSDPCCLDDRGSKDL
jgi:hypothetical protein